MGISIDILIFFIFLIVNLLVGMVYGRGMLAVKNYTVDPKKVVAAAIVASLLTWVGGGIFAWNFLKSYHNSWPFIMAVGGNGISIFILGYFYGPKIDEFLKCDSPEEILDRLQENVVSSLSRSAQVNILKKDTLNVLLNIAVTFTLLCAGTLLALTAGLTQFQTTILVLNNLMVAFMLRWQVLTSLSITFSLFSLMFFQGQIDNASLPTATGLPDYKITYLLLLVSSVLIWFLKTWRKDSSFGTSPAKTDHILGKAKVLQAEFIENITHEYNEPMARIKSTAQVLADSYDSLDDAEKKLAINNILRRSAELERFDTTLHILSRLGDSKGSLVKTEINLSELVRERFIICKRLYDEEKSARDFILYIAPNVMISCEADYMKHVLDNLLINAICYCTAGVIEINLTAENRGATFSVRDEGIGIPPEDIYEIFHPFVVSSRTKVRSGGRGLGLTLCKEVIEAHNGTIWAESKQRGAKFTFTIPIE